MAKNSANHVSLQTFAKAYAKIQKSGGTVIDLMNECEMVNVGSVRQKINHLREAFPDLKPLKRRSNSGQTAAQEAAGILAALFADDNEESSDTDEKTEETDTEENDTEEMTTTETNDSASV